MIKATDIACGFDHLLFTGFAGYFQNICNTIINLLYWIRFASWRRGKHTI